MAHDDLPEMTFEQEMESVHGPPSKHPCGECGRRYEETLHFGDDWLCQNCYVRREVGDDEDLEDYVDFFAEGSGYHPGDYPRMW